MQLEDKEGGDPVDNLEPEPEPKEALDHQMNSPDHQ